MKKLIRILAIVAIAAIAIVPVYVTVVTIQNLSIVYEYDKDFYNAMYYCFDYNLWLALVLPYLTIAFVLIIQKFDISFKFKS